MLLVVPLLFRLLPHQAYRAMALWPFILVKSKDLMADPVINHEKIHLRQQLECLILPFYLLYFGEYLIARIKRKDHDQAYRHISFEKEAYKNDTDLNYLKKRKMWANFRSA